MTILAALTPSKPNAPTTTVTGSTVTISWTAPNDNGNAIQGYVIYIGQSDNTTYSVNIDNCDGTTDSAILSSTKCQVPISVLIASPYSLPWGSHVYAKVLAYSGNGNSLTSEIGNGALILTNPDPPTNLVETVVARTKSTITFTWTPPVLVGGSNVIDY